MGVYIIPNSNSFLPLSGGTVSGQTLFLGNLTATTFYSGTTELSLLLNGGSGISSSIGNGINTFTAGTPNFQTINVTALTINTLSVSGDTTLSSTTASNITIRSLSGGGVQMVVTDDLGNISAQSIPAAGQSTVIRNGLNTYTAGTIADYRVNVSALTINTITASGNSVFSGTLSGGSAFSANTLFSGTTDLSSVINNVFLNNYSQTGNLAFFFSSGSSDVSGYYKMVDYVPDEPETYLIVPNAADGDLIQTFVTEPNYPNITFIPSGIWSLHMHAYRTSGGNNRIVQLYADIYKLNTANTETFITTSNPSVELLDGNDNNLPTVTFYVSAQTISSTDRIVCKIRSYVHGTGGNPTVHFGIGDLTYARIQIPSNIFSVNNFIPYSGANHNVYLNTKNLSTLGSVQAGTFYSGTTNLENLFIVSGVSLTTNRAVFKQKVGNILQFRGIYGSGGTTVSTYSNYLKITSPSIPTGAYLWTVGGTDGAIKQNVPVSISNGKYSLSFGSNSRVYSDYSIVLGQNIIINSLSRNSTIIAGINNTIYSNSKYSSILGSNSSTILGYGNSILGGITNIISSYSSYKSQYSGIISGQGNKLYSGKFSIVLAGKNNTLGQKTTYYSDYNAIVAGRLNSLTKSSYAAILAGYSNVLYNSSNSSIIVGKSNTINRSFYSGIFAGTSNLINSDAVTNKFNNVIIGGNGNQVLESISSGILLGKNNILNNSTYSVIIGGNGYSINSVTNTVVVPNLIIKNLPSTIGDYMIVTNTNGNIFKNSIPVNSVVSNGINTFTGGTSLIQTINVTGGTFGRSTFSATSNNYALIVSGATLLTGGLTASSLTSISISGTSLSGANIFSGTTNLYSIFAPIGSTGGQSTFVQPGTNTYTGGTTSNPTINVSALTISQLITSGNTILSSITASTVTVGSLSGGGTLMVVTDNSGNLSAQSIPSAGQSTVIRNGLNTYTAGTTADYTVNVSALTINTLTASGNSIFSGTLSGGSSFSANTIFSGTTNLNNIFSQIGHTHQFSTILNTAHTHTVGEIENLQSLLNTKVNKSGDTMTGTLIGTAISATTISGETIYSGTTNLYNIFALAGTVGGVSTYIQPGTNTYTGGTSSAPTVNVSALTINTLIVSGNSVFSGTLSGGSSFSANTLFSGTTNLNELFMPNKTLSGGTGIELSSTTSVITISLKVDYTNQFLFMGG